MRHGQHRRKPSPRNASGSLISHDAGTTALQICVCDDSVGVVGSSVVVVVVEAVLNAGTALKIVTKERIASLSTARHAMPIFALLNRCQRCS